MPLIRSGKNVTPFIESNKYILSTFNKTDNTNTVAENTYSAGTAVSFAGAGQEAFTALFNVIGKTTLTVGANSFNNGVHFYGMANGVITALTAYDYTHVNTYDISAYEYHFVGDGNGNARAVTIS